MKRTTTFFGALLVLGLAVAAAPALAGDRGASTNNAQGSTHGKGHQHDGTDEAEGGHASHGNGNGYGHGPGTPASVPELDVKVAGAASALMLGGVAIALGRRRKL